MESLSGVGVIDKAAAILNALGDGPLDLAELQDVADLPRATAHRLAVALEASGAVRSFMGEAGGTKGRGL